MDRIAFDFLSLKTAMKYSATFCTRPEKADLPHIRHCADERTGRREFPKGISIVALTTSAMKGGDARVIDTRCADYIAKRIDIWQFSDKVASYLDIADVQT